MNCTSTSVKISLLLALAIKLVMLKTWRVRSCACLIKFVYFLNWYKFGVKKVLVPFSISPFERFSFRTGSSQHSLEVNINFAFNTPPLPHCFAKTKQSRRMVGLETRMISHNNDSANFSGTPGALSGTWQSKNIENTNKRNQRRAAGWRSG